MEASYFSNTDLLNVILGDNPSNLWSSILEAQDALIQGCRRNIGTGLDSFV